MLTVYVFAVKYKYKYKILFFILNIKMNQLVTSQYKKTDMNKEIQKKEVIDARKIKREREREIKR